MLRLALSFHSARLLPLPCCEAIGWEEIIMPMGAAAFLADLQNDKTLPHLTCCQGRTGRRNKSYCDSGWREGWAQRTSSTKEDEGIASALATSGVSGIESQMSEAVALTESWDSPAS